MHLDRSPEGPGSSATQSRDLDRSPEGPASSALQSLDLASGSPERPLSYLANSR